MAAGGVFKMMMMMTRRHMFLPELTDWYQDIGDTHLQLGMGSPSQTTRPGQLGPTQPGNIGPGRAELALRG
jgi:hypothetical protein